MRQSAEGEAMAPGVRGMWFVIWTLTGQEEKAKTLLEKTVDDRLYSRLVIVYRDRIEKRRGERVLVRKRLFPGYLFLETDDIGPFARAIRSEIRIGSILHDSESYQPLNERDEYILRELIDEEGTIGVSTGIIENDAVRITAGPLTGREVRIRRIDRHRLTAVLAMEAFGRETEFVVGLEILSKIRTTD